MTVLILAPATDEHALAVAGEVRRLGSRAEIVDQARFPEHASLAMTFDSGCACRSARIRVDGRWLDLDEVTGVWWRRPNWPRVAEDMAAPSHRAFALNETHEALGGLWHSHTLDAVWVNDPAADERAGRKGYQLTRALRNGLELPVTLMTNDPDEARSFADSRGYRGIVFKSFASTDREWRETRLLTEEDLGLLHHVQHAPVIFQEYVPARYDLRVTIVGKRAFAAAIHSQQTAYPVDSRIDIGNAVIEPVDLPEDVAALLLQLCADLGLVYGAADLRLAPDGRYVFLEINPAGQFRYIQQATGLPITEAVAAALLGRSKDLGDERLGPLVPGVGQHVARIASLDHDPVVHEG